MAPAITSGQFWLVRCGVAISPGEIVLAVHPQRPDLHVIKRVIRPTPGGWWLEGDNQERSTDSRHYGPVEQVLGRLMWCYWPITGLSSARKRTAD